MSLLTMIQNAALEQGLPKPEAIVESTDVTTRQMLAIANRTMKEVRGRAWWPKLTKLHTMSLVALQDRYALPADIDRQIHRTHWNQARKWEILGPATPQEMEAFSSGTNQTPIRQIFRLLGWGDSQFQVFPVPTASDAGQVIVFQYQSTTTARPIAWTTATAFAPGSYCSNNGIVYYTILGGVTGILAPFWDSGSFTDGGVTWDAVQTSYSEFRADTDECLFDEDMIGLGIQWRFMQQKGLSFEKIEQEFEKAVVREITAETGARTLSLTGRGRTPLLSNLNIPETGLGI